MFRQSCRFVIMSVTLGSISRFSTSMLLVRYLYSVMLFFTLQKGFNPWYEACWTWIGG